MRIIAKIASVFVLLVASLGMSNGVGHAADMAQNSRNLYLTSSPNSGMQTACWSRDILLAEGNYIWGMYNPEGSAYRYIDLKAGLYRWTSCLKPENNFYLQSDELDPQFGDLPTARISYNFRAPSRSNYLNVAGQLTPRF